MNPAPAGHLVYKDRKVLLKYHRLLSGVHQYPPNSIPALKQVLAEGAEVIEFDIGLAQDGVFALIHDERLERETTGLGPLRLITSDQFKSLRLRGTDVAPTTLPEVVDVVRSVRRPLKVQVDLKEQEPLGRDVGARLLEALAPMRANPHVRVVIGCLADWNLRLLRRLDPTLHVGVDFALYLDAPVDEFVRLPSRVNVHGYLDDHPLGFRTLLPTRPYLEDRMEVLLGLVDGAAEFYVRKEFLLQALADGVNPVRFIHERRPGALVDVWTLYSYEANIAEVLRTVLEAGADQISSPTSGVLHKFL